MGWFGFSYGGAVLGYLAVNALASRMLGAEFASFVIALSVSMVIGQLGLFGAHRGGLREAARLESGDDAGLADLRREVRAVSIVTLPVTALLGAAAAFFVFADESEAARWALAALMGVLVWLSGQQKLWANYLRGFGRVRLAGLLEGRSGGALVALGQALAIGAVLLRFPESALTGALAAMAVGFAVPVLFAWSVVWRGWRHAAVGVPAPRDVRRAVVRNRHFASNMLGGALNTNMELWLAGLLLSALDASLYSAANRLSLLLPIFIMSLGVVFSPSVSRMYGREDDKLERLLRTGATIAAVLTAVLWLPMLLAPGFLLEVVFGAPFGPAAPLLVILTVGGASNVLTGLCSVTLTMSRHEAIVAKVQWVAVAARLALGLVLGWQFGAVGLAVSAAVVTTVLWSSLWYVALRRTGMRTHLTLRPEPGLLRRVSA